MTFVYMRSLFLAALTVCIAACGPQGPAAEQANAPRYGNGLVDAISAYGVSETLDRLAAAALADGMKVFARIDHAAGAAMVGQKLPDMQLLLFGNPQVGTPIIQAARTAGIDLPIKALAFVDDAGQTHLVINDPLWLAQRHGITQDVDGVLEKAMAVRALVRQATSSSE